jgi:hypothetical protein
MKNMFLSAYSLSFMLPTQAIGAIILDGTPIIAIGGIILAYYLVVNLKNHNTENNTVSVEQDSLNTNQNTNEVKNTDTLNEIKRVNHYNRNVEEDYAETVKQEKEVIFNK